MTRGAPSAEPPRGRWPEWAVCAAIMLPAIGFQWWAAERYTLFDDEAFSFQRYVMPAGELVAALRRHVEPDPPLYYLCVHGWILLSGIEPRDMRGLSIVCFALGLLALHAAARASHGPRTANCALLIAALHPLHLQFGLAARWYSLMFLCISCALWTAARASADARLHAASTRRQMPWRWHAGWVLAATAACYTNYFAPCVIGLLWLVNLMIAWPRRAARTAWLASAVAVLLLFAIWLPVFLEQLARFPRLERSIGAYAASAARTAVAAATGNLADPGGLTWTHPGAWWVWLPMCAGICLMIWLATRMRRTEWPLLVVVTGSAAAGIATLSMIDKYVMTFSAPLCLLAAALICGRAGAPFQVTRVRRLAGAAIAVAWCGCAVNLALERHWTSVRWLDPFALVAADIHARWQPGDVLVATHPSARYYWGLRHASAVVGGDKIRLWLGAAGEVVHPSALAERVTTGPARVWVIETAATGSDAAGMAMLLSATGSANSLHGKGLRVIDKRELALDPLAERKNQLDPHYNHPAYRIRIWLFGR